MSKRLLCIIGLHKWKNQHTVEWEHDFGMAFMEGDVCRKCGKHKVDPIESTQGLPQDYKIIGPM